MKKLLFFIAIVMCVAINPQAVHAAASPTTQKEVNAEIKKLETEIASLEKKEKEENDKIKEEGLSYIAFGSLISRNPYIIEYTSFFGGTSYYWITNPEAVTEVLGVVGCYIKPTGEYKTYNYYTCAVAKAVATKSYTSQISSAKEKLNKLQKSLKDNVTMENSTVVVGKSKKIQYDWYYGGTYNKITWVSSDPSIATVSDKGVVTGKANGEVTITATMSISKKKSKCSVSVITPATSIELSNTEVSMHIDETYTLDAKLAPNNTNSTVTYTSNNKKVATVSSEGVITAHKKGTATITVKTSNGLKAKCKVTVVSNLLSMEFDADNIVVDLNSDQTAWISLTASPWDTEDTISFTSSDETVAMIEDTTYQGDEYAGDDGEEYYEIRLKILGKGVCIITATSTNGLTTVCNVTVTDNDSDVDSY